MPKSSPSRKKGLLDVRNYTQSDFTDLHEDDEEKFQDQEVLEAWKSEKIRLNIVVGSKTMLIVILIVSIEHIWKYSGDFLRERECWKMDLPEERSVQLTIVEFIFLLLISGAFFFCSKRPILWVYMIFVAACSIYLLMLGLPPWAMSCEDILLMSWCVDRSNTRWQGYLENLDCSLQGYSSVQVHLVWLLLTPRIIPSMGWLNYNLVWIFCFNLGASLWYNRTWPRITYSEWDIAMTVGLLVLTHFIARQRKFYMMKAQFKKFVNEHKQREASWKMFQILQYMVPPHVAVPMLKNPGEVIAQDVNPVSILFVMIVDFDQYTRNYTPGELLEFLNQYFTLMDSSCASHNVTKIETVGEEYVAAVGVVPDDIKKYLEDGHGEALGRLVKVVYDILQLQGSEVQFKLGMHTGPVVAGVIGKKLPRFRLFGDTINTAARMMQKGEAGKCQFGEATKAQLPGWVQVEAPRVIEMKGKGQVTAYFLDDNAPANYGQSPSCIRTPASKRSKRRVSFDENVQEDHAVDNTNSVISSRIMQQRGSASDLRAAHAQQSRRRPSLVDEQWFEHALHELASNEDSDRHAYGWLSFLCFCKRCINNWTKKEEFSPAMEEEWLHWYHEHAICKKLEDRLDRQEKLLAIITAIDTVYLVVSGVVDEPTKSTYIERLPFYLCCRFSAFGIILLWRFMARSGGSVQHLGGGVSQSPAAKKTMTIKSDQSSSSHKSADQIPAWMLENPRRVQRCITLSWMCIASLMILSYDSLSYQYHFGWARGSEEKLEEEASKVERRSNMPSLLVVPVYAMVSTQHPLPFQHQVAFFGLAILLMCNIGTVFAMNLIIPINCKIYFVIDNLVSAWVSLSAERGNRARYKAMRILKDTYERTEKILNTLLPLMVVEEIRDLPSDAVHPSHNYGCATIAQSDLCGFTKLASTRQPKEVVEFISELFGLFDNLTDEHGVYKVETVGDAYIAGQAEAPLTRFNKPTSVILFGFDMVRATQDWAKRRGWDVNCRVGVHTGECIGGIVGTGMQRYHLFGDLMTGVEVLESTAIEGKVQVSPACREAAQLQISLEHLPADFITFREREGDCLTTSKGEVHEFEEVGGRTYIVTGHRRIIARVLE